MPTDYAFAPTEAQTAAMTEMKTLMPGVHWHQVYNSLRASYPDDFKDNDHDVYVVANHYAAIPEGEPPPPEQSPAPVIAALVPDTTPANADVELAIGGEGFDPGAAVMVGPAELVPIDIASPTDLRVEILAINISMPGAVEISVKNSDGQISNVMSLSLT